MDLDALRTGIKWDFESFGDYMAMLRRRGAYANVAVLAGHSTIRTAVMGEAASQRKDATPEELAKMKAMVADAMANGAIGLGASYSLNHSGYGGVPMPSTIAPMEELDALVGAMGPRGQRRDRHRLGREDAAGAGADGRQARPAVLPGHRRGHVQRAGARPRDQDLRRLRRRDPARQRALHPDSLPAAQLRLHDGERLSVLQPFGVRPDQGLQPRAAEAGVPRRLMARQVPREREEPAAGHDLPGQLGSRHGGGDAQARQRQIHQPLPARDRRGRASRSARHHARPRLDEDLETAFLGRFLNVGDDGVARL